MWRSTITMLAIAGAALLASAGSTDAGYAGARRLPIDELGTGTVSDDPCLDSSGRCGFVLNGSLDGVPADDTFYIVIDDDGAANPAGCVPATYAGLLGDGPDQRIGHTARGQLCPDGSGGYVFDARFKITGGLGAFEGARGRGDVVALIGADGSATLTVTGSYRLPR